MKKRIANAMAIMAALSVLCLGQAPKAADALKEKTIKTLDSVNFDGATISYSYTVESKCPANSHSSFVELSPVTKDKYVTGFKIEVIDAAYEGKCSAAVGPVYVSGKENLAIIIERESNKQKGKGLKIAPEYTIQLLPVKPSKDGAAKAPASVSAPVAAVQPKPAIPEKVMVNVVEYTAGWRCELWKRDGARKDGFVGTGSTLDEARNNAATSCMSTNNPYCHDYSKNPAHTTCDVQINEKTKLVEYDSDKLPAGAAISSWSCNLMKNDGSSRDGFIGEGTTEQEARTRAAGLCKSTNNPLCDQYSQNDNHTSCAPAYLYAGPKPATQWTCTLWKRDGARNDGFTGTGSTEKEARNNTVPGCQRTNHPKCYDFSVDPSHTACSVDLVYPR
ncbi:MAG TPA: hypothetical protein PLK80_15415 [bacterium]|nr:hypothetical protein [bacterium]